MKITFDEKEHVYAINGDIAITSITALLHKHGLAPDYSKVDSEVLARKAEYGKEIHKDCELAVNDTDYVPKTWQGTMYRRWVSEIFNGAVAEQLVGIDYKKTGLLIGGTADLVAITKKGEYAIADIKNTAAVNAEYERWQQSLEDYFLRHCGEINGKPFNGYTGATTFVSVHFGKEEGDFKTVYHNPIPDEEIERLLDAEYNGEIYQRPTLVVDNDLLSKWHDAETYFADIERLHKQAGEKVKELREQLCTLMETQNIKSYEDDHIKITYKAPFDRQSVDSTKLKREYPNAYTACQKISRVKASVVVTLKNNDEGDEYDDF